MTLLCSKISDTKAALLKQPQLFHQKSGNVRVFSVLDFIGQSRASRVNFMLRVHASGLIYYRQF